VADDALRGVRLERLVELGSVRLRAVDWPGHGGPLVCVPDPFAPEDRLAERLAAAFAPMRRVVRVEPRLDVPYQVQVDDIRRTLEQFGLFETLLVSSGRGTCVILPLAAWHGERVRAVVLIDPRYDAPTCNGLPARALRECPPDWASIQRSIDCPVLTASAADLLGVVRKVL
jgi:pimeloyl-ACP methyl ester carboxylesterase